MKTTDARRLLSLPVALLAVAACGEVPAEAVRTAISDVDYYVDREDGRLRIQELVVHNVGEENVIPDSTRARLEEAS